MASSSYANFFFEWSLFAGKCTFGLFSLLALLLYTNQDRLLYIPNPPGFPQKPSDNPSPLRSPSEWTVKGKRSFGSDNIPFEEEYLSTTDGKLIHTWLMLQANSDNVPTLIYFHGNAGEVASFSFFSVVPRNLFCFVSSRTLFRTSDIITSKNRHQIW